MIDVSKLRIKVRDTEMEAEFVKWLTDNARNFESEQDAVDEMNYWVNNNVGRFMEVVVE
jgi:hypothetical protein